MKVQFNNKQARMLGTCTGRKLMPGKNAYDMSEEELQTILADDQFKGWQRLGWIAFVQPQMVGTPFDGKEVVKEFDGESPEDALKDLNVEDSLPVIAACSDPELLLQWFDRESRVTLKRVIEKRIEELDPGEEDEPNVVDVDDNPESVDEVFGD